MPDVELQNTVDISRTYPAPSATSDHSSDRGQLATIAIFSGLGLLVSLIAGLCGVQGYWY